jgi:hypothetical protein
MDNIIERSVNTVKFILCVLQCQFGKTFTAINKIMSEIREDSEKGKSIHIVFTMNTLLNNKQFEQRIYEKIQKQFGECSICVLSSGYKQKNKNEKKGFKHVNNFDELLGFCVRDTPQIIVMCSNNKRFDDGFKFLKEINKQPIGNIKRAFPYFDELHKYINSCRSHIEEINNLNIVKGITGFSATPNIIFQDRGYWQKLKLIEYDNYSDENYCGHRDMIFNNIDDCESKNVLDFIKYILNKFPNILNPNTRTFIPAANRKHSHQQVRSLIFEINSQAVVCLINGDEKTMQYKDDMGHMKTLSLISNTEEVCETIATLMKKHNLLNRPLVITGFICVGMGQTLTHETLGPFTSAIFGHVDLVNDDMYQLFGRICGRMKQWSSYIQTEVYCPTIIMNRCIAMEECARNMINYNGDHISGEDYREPITNTENNDVINNMSQNNARSKRMIDDCVYGFKSFEFDMNSDTKSIQIVLTEFRKNIGGAKVQNRTIESRLNGIEPDDKLGEIMLQSFKDNPQLLKTGMNKNTHNRIRVCKKSEFKLVFVITFRNNKNEFKWKNDNLRIHQNNYSSIYHALKDCEFIEKNSVEEIEKETEDEISKSCNSEYGESIDGWSQSNRTKVISKLYNIHIHEFKMTKHPNGGYEFIDYIHTSQLESQNHVYIRVLNEQQYNLMEKMD